MVRKLPINFKITQISGLQLFQLIRFSTLMLIGVVFAKSGLTTSQIGQYETFLFLASAICFFWLNGLIQGFLPSSKNESGSGRSSALFNVFYLVTAFSGLSAIFLFLFEKSLSGHLLKGSDIPFLNYLLVYILISSPASLVEYVYLIKNQGKQMINYAVISYTLMFVLVALPPVFGESIEMSMTGLVASAAFRLAWLLVLLFRNSVPEIDFGFMKQNLKSAWPLIVSMLLSGSGQYIDGFIITAYFNDATFAVFRYGAREFPLVLLLANAFSASMLPGFADHINLKSNLEKIRNNSQKLGFWLFPLSGVMMLVSHWAFPIVFNVSFTGSATIFNIYLLLIISRLLFPQTILIGLQITTAIMWASFFEIVVNVSISLWFLQYWGIVGVAYGTVIAYIFEKLVLMLFVRKTNEIKVKDYLDVRQHLVYSVLLTAEFFMVEFVIY
ncbi:MAG: polysaccharide biosynthesis C-terminal domain-containing protein [Prolixibacteraceae bacterium]